jgi:uncharacterized membrane protein YqaE (UPF0057 family)
MKSNLLLLLATVFMLASCSDKLSLMKRKYNKGFYIAKSSSVRATGKEVAEQRAKAKERDHRGEVSEKAITATVGEIMPALSAPPQKSESVSKTTTGTHRNITVQVSPDNEPLQEPINIKPLDMKKNTSVAQNLSGDSDVDMIILVILAILIPPLAVWLKDKAVSKWFWITLILCVLSFSVFFFNFGGLLWLAAMVIALLYVLDML